MKKINFVDAKNLKTLEDYGASLLAGLMSLKTLEAFHIQAFKKGLLDEDELETGKTICWEIERLVALYRTQINHILDRTQLDEQQVLTAIKEMVKDEKKNGVTNPRRKKKD